MLRNIPSLQKLLRQLQHIPYLASKNLYRVASHILSSEQDQVEQLCRAIMEAKEKVRPCKDCFNWVEFNSKDLVGLCSICSSDRRDRTKICVVETWHDLLAIEKTDDYYGLYHILGGALSPLEGIGPDDLTVDTLVRRVRESEATESPVKEIILATNPTPEGEATASFIASKLEDTKVETSRLASGIPIGYSLEQMDRVTIHKALSGRRPF